MASPRVVTTNALIFKILKAIQATLPCMSDDLREIKKRLGILDMQYANLSRRADRLGQRIERIERRPDLVEG